MREMANLITYIVLMTLIFKLTYKKNDQKY